MFFDFFLKKYHHQQQNNKNEIDNSVIDFSISRNTLIHLKLQYFINFHPFIIEILLFKWFKHWSLSVTVLFYFRLHLMKLKYF